jgi:hypothetical protein
MRQPHHSLQKLDSEAADAADAAEPANAIDDYFAAAQLTFIQHDHVNIPTIHNIVWLTLRSSATALFNACFEMPRKGATSLFFLLQTALFSDKVS